MRYYLHRFGIITLFYAVLFLTTAEDVRSKRKSNEFDEYVYYQGVQGRPGIDFPVFARIPRTTFSCKQVPSGYYADLETDCQVFHICNEGSKISFLCPNGTIFQQSDLICEWWFKVNCTNSPSLYEESAEQLLEETWRRKEGRRPGYQNRVATQEKKKAYNVKTGQGERKSNGNGSRRKNQQGNNVRQQFELNPKETFPGSPNEQYFSNQNPNNGRNFPSKSVDQNKNVKNEFPAPNGRSNQHNKLQSRGNQKYKRPVTLKGRNELNFEDSSEESQVLAETASFYNSNKQNSIQATSKATTKQYPNPSLNYNTNKYLNQNYNQTSSQNLNPFPSQNFNQNSKQTSNQNLNPFPSQNFNPIPKPTSNQNLNPFPSQNFNQDSKQASNQNSNSFPGENFNQYTNQNPDQDSAQNSNFKSKQKSNRNLNPFFNQNSNQYPNHQTSKQESPQNSNQVPNLMNYDTTQKLNYDTTQNSYEYTTQNSYHDSTHTSNYDTTTQDTHTTQNSNLQYPNHKETYTEIQEPKFVSTKTYTTGPQTIPPQTVSTNRIPLNDGKPFVVSTPKSFYNIKEFTTENFVYSPTVPPFTTTRKSIIIPQNTDNNLQEEVTFSAPYSNVVTETQKPKKETEYKDVEVVTPISGIEDSTTIRNEPEILSENGNKTEYVRINGGYQNEKENQPESFQISVSTAQNTIVTTLKAPVVHRRYSAAISQANPNNACIDEVVNSKGTTRAPKSRVGSGRSSVIISEDTTTISSIITSEATPTENPITSPTISSKLSEPSTTGTTDFGVVIGRKRKEPESKVINISKYPEVHQPRSFEAATESPVYRIDLKNQAVEKVTEKAYTLKPTGFYVTKSFNGNNGALSKPSTKFGSANTYLPKETTPRGELETNKYKEGTPVDTLTITEDFDVVQKPKPFELPPRISGGEILTISHEVTDSSIPDYEVSSARPFALESTVLPTHPTVFTSAPSRSPKVFEHVTSMLNSLNELIKKDNNETDTRAGLVVPPSVGPQTLHSLAVYFANALDGVVTENESETTTENDDRAIELLSIPTLNRYKELFKEEEETTTQIVTEDTNDLEGQHTKTGIVTPRVRQLAQVFTKALSSYLDDPDMFRKYLQDVRPTEPTRHVGTTQRSVDNNNTEEDELLNYSDADIKPDLPRLSTTPSVSPTWGYILAPNNSSNYEYNSLSTDGENLQSADSQSFVSQFNHYIKEKHFYGKTTTPISTDLPKDHWTTSQNATDLWRDKLYTNPQAINEDLNTKAAEVSTESSLEATEISYELRSLPKLELNSTQVHGILIDFVNTTRNENSRLNRILSKLNTTQNEFLTKMREIEQNPLTRRLILLLISECANNVTEINHKDSFASASSSDQEHVKDLSNVNLFDSSRTAESDKHVTKNSAIPKFVDQTLKDEDEDTRALELVNSLYTIASRYGK